MRSRESSASTAKDFSDAAALTAQAQELKKAALEFKREGRNTEAIAYVSVMSSLTVHQQD